MKINKYFLELTNQINDIINNIFEIKTLRKAQLITKRANILHNQKKISYTQKMNIINYLNEAIDNKLLELNPTLAKNTLDKIHAVFNQNYNSIPTDLTIINNDLVFYHEEAYDNPYISQTTLLNEQNYTEITNKNNKTTNMELLISILIKVLTNEIQYETVTKQINEIVAPISYKKQNIKYNKETCKLEYTSNIKLFTNYTIDEIIYAINTQKEITINLIALNDWNEFHYFEIKQTPTPDKSFIWTSKEIQPNIWNLSENINKTNKHTLTKTKEY